MKKCPSCGELLGNDVAECFKCGRNVEDEYGTDYPSKYASNYVPSITGFEIFACIVWPGVIFMIASCRCVLRKDRSSRRFILPSSIVMALMLTLGAIVGTMEMKILAGVMIIPPLLASIGMKLFGKKDFKESLMSSCIVVGVLMTIFCGLVVCYFIYLYLHGLES